MHLEDWLFGDLIPRFQDRILTIDTSVVLTWSKIVGSSKKEGYILPTVDSLIAATALTHNLILVTENTKDFEKSGATIFNPWV